MKKILCSIIICILLCGCSKAASIKPITKSLKFATEINYFNETYNCNVKIAKNGDTEISFTNPKEINGLIIKYSADKVIAEYFGLEREIDNQLPQYSASDIIYKVFSYDYENVFEDNDRYYSENKNLNCKIYFGETGLPISVEENSSKFKMTIINATITE